MTMTNTQPNGVAYNWVAVGDLAKIYGMISTLLMYHAKSQGIPTQKIKGKNFIRSTDVEILRMCVVRSQMREELKKDPNYAYMAAVRHRQYENKKRKALGLEPLIRLKIGEKPTMTEEEILQQREQRRQEKLKALDIEVIFELNDRVKRGKLIGGKIKGEIKTALIRYVDKNGLKQLASVFFENVRCCPVELENNIVKLHKAKIA